MLVFSTAYAAEDSACAFDPTDISLTDVVQLYSCVPIADGLCAKTCGDKAISTGINTKIENARLGKTTILCVGGDIKEKTAQDASVNGMAHPISIECAPAAIKK